MKKIVLLLLIIAGIAIFEPRTRQRILELFPSLSAATQQRSAERAVRQIALDIQQDASASGVYLQPSGFAEWLDQTRWTRHDPWGTDYYLELYPDSFVVGSPGPDALRRTSDDVRLARLRGPDAARSRPVITPPAPPASGVKASAIGKAKEAATRKVP